MASSLSPLKVNFEVHVKNREKLLKSIRQHLSQSSLPLHGFVLLQGGDEQTRYDTDHLELFRQESYFAYLFGVQEPGFYGAIDVGSGDSILFAPRLPDEYAVWMGKIKQLSHFKEHYMVTKAYFTDEIATGIDKFDKDLTTLHPILTECRVIKSELEIDLIQYANDISSEAHIEVMRKAKVGMKEYQLESIFLHHTYMYGGCRHCSYTCICATGDNSAVLHYGHAAAPNDKTLEDGDMALLDMGAEYHFYGSDITCSYPINGKFTSDQSLIYNAVLDAHDAVIASMKPGVSWVDMHILSHKVILESLKKGHIVVGNVDDTMVALLGSVFMPHGLGHLLGIDTHDPGGYPKGLERRKEPGLKGLRTARRLQEGMVITVEPGCYFIEALLLPAMNNPETSKYFNKEVITRFIGFGGVRIESDVLVTAAGCYNMTNCPRKIHEIEAVMAGAPWPVKKTSTRIENGLENKA
ncbi:hypothetical protein TSUD_75330 [Trifolium subterraneum]|nr:hypothetical protein TSUD_75330 [Trifolium subterraneum]